jgi:beta-glucanase (GH16 family)
MLVGLLATAAAGDGGWRLTFSEDFAAANNFTQWSKSNNTIEGAMDDDQTYFAENAAVRDGMLVIETRQRQTTLAGRTTNFTSAWVTTQGYFSQRFGRFAFRARLPNGSAPGIFPALWLMPEPPAKCWPTGGEIDVMEYVNHPGCERGSCQVHGTLHWGDACGKGLGHGATGWWGRPSANITDDFHVFSVEWSTAALTWSVDGVPFWSQNSSTVEIPQTPFFFIINTARRPEPWRDFPWPVRFEIDWVRAWAPVGAPPTSEQIPSQ